MTDRAQDTEAIRAARLDDLVAQIQEAYLDDAYGSSFQLKIAAYWPELAAERVRLVARLEAAQEVHEALERLVAQLETNSEQGAPEYAHAALAAAAPGETTLTHGRHCPCSACAREDWTRITGPCGMHGADCPAVYAPAAPGETEQTP